MNLNPYQFANTEPVHDREGWDGPEGSFGTPGQSAWSTATLLDSVGGSW